MYSFLKTLKFMKLTGLWIVCILLLGSVETNAQQSMLEDVNVPYLDTLVKIAKKNYPRQKINIQNVAIAQYNVNKVKISWFEGISLFYLYLPKSVGDSVLTTVPTNPALPVYTINQSRAGGFQLGFSLNIGSLLQKPAAIKAEKKRKEVAMLEKDEYELTLEADVKERYYNYITQITLLKRRATIVLDADAALTSVKSKYERGQETFDNYNKAQIILNQQIVDKINTENEMLTAKAHLEELLGVKLETIIL